MPENKWIICMGERSEPAWFEGSENGGKGTPVVHDSEKEAAEKVLENFIDELSMQLDQLRNGEREPQDIDLECDEYVLPCVVHEGGLIRNDSDIIYDPKIYKR